MLTNGLWFSTGLPGEFQTGGEYYGFLPGNKAVLCVPVKQRKVNTGFNLFSWCIRETHGAVFSICRYPARKNARRR